MGAARDPRVAMCAVYVESSVSSMGHLPVQRVVTQLTAPGWRCRQNNGYQRQHLAADRHLRL